MKKKNSWLNDKFIPSLLFGNAVYDYLLEKSAPSEILFSPEDFWGGSAKIGKEIVEGNIIFFGESFTFKDYVWEQNNASKFWNEELHSFSWLKDVRSLGTNKARIFVRKNILEWIESFGKWYINSWKTDVLAKRIVNLLSHFSFYFNTANENFQKKISKNLNKQAIHLFKLNTDSFFENEKIFIAKAKILSTLSFKSLRSKFDREMENLDGIINSNLLGDGMHYLRSPSEHFYFLRALIDIKYYLGAFKITIPKTLNKRISRMSAVLKFFKIANGHLSIFNNYVYVEKGSIEQIIKIANSRIKAPHYLSNAGFYRVSENRLIFILDGGTPSIEKTHAGSLAFEFSYGNEKIVTNCGSPYIYNKKWSKMMRSTPAYSTLSIDNYNSSDIFNGSSVAKVWSKNVVAKNNYWISSSHSGYENRFGLVHNRKIHIDTLNLIIRGKDYLSKTKMGTNSLPKKIYIRFHIHPDIKLSVTTSKKKVVLKLKNNLGWEFICSEPTIDINEGIYLGDRRLVQKNNHILVSGDITANKEIKWLFRLIK